jgi:predicted membrane metal-binding protein
MGLLGLGAVSLAGGEPHVSLCAAGMVMLAINPLALWDIGFQLSFASLGLILFSRPLGTRLHPSCRDVCRPMTRGGS